MKSLFPKTLHLVLILGVWGGFSDWAQVATALPTATNLWEFSLSTRLQGDRGCSSPAVAADGTIYLGTFEGNLIALLPDGRKKWRFKVGLEIASSPAIADDGTVYFGSRDRHLYAVNPEGRLGWRFATQGWVDASPAIAADGTVYFGCWDHFFYALKPDGSLKWQYPVGAIVDASAAIGRDGTIYFGAHDHYFYALNPDGSLRWRFATGGEIIASPALGSGGEIYFSSLDGNLYALNPDGTERWRLHTGSTTASGPVLDEVGNLCIGHNNCTLVISKNGQNLWHSGAAVPVEVSGVALSRRFYFSVPWRTLQAVGTSDRRIWQADFSDNVSASPTLKADGTLYVVAGGSLYAVRPPDPGLPPAASPWPMFQADARHTGRAGR